MKVTLTIVADVDEAGLARYMAAHPRFRSELPTETFVREAISAWADEQLLAEVPEWHGRMFEQDAATQTWRPKHEL